MRSHSIALLSFLLSVTYVSKCPVLRVLAAVPGLLSPHFAYKHGDQDVHRVSSARIVS